MQPLSESAPPGDGLSALCRLVAPRAMHVRFVGGARPFELAWDDAHGSASVSAATLEGAVHAAARVLLAQRAFPPVTEPAGDTGYAEAMRELIEATAHGAQSARPRLRLVR